MSVVILDGNIGAGKSTFLRKIFENQCTVNGTKIQVIQEPVKRWTNGPMGNLLTAVKAGQISSAVFQVNFSSIPILNSHLGVRHVNFCTGASFRLTD